MVEPEQMLPDGTVTFLLTDIEGSTRAWEEHEPEMAKAVASHYEILDAVVTGWGGVRPIEQGEGDSLVAAFPRATDAVRRAPRPARLAGGGLARRHGTGRTNGNLPTQLTSFIGREQELGEVAVALSEHRLVTLVGAGGCGKTRLAVQMAGELVDAGQVRWPVNQPAYDATLGSLRSEVGDGAFESAWKEGAALSLEEVCAYASRARGERKRPSRGWESLTPTELEVVGLAAAGLSNAEIGARLFISPTTAKTHLAHIYAKLGIANRAALAAQATARDAKRCPRGGGTPCTCV